MYDRDPQQPPPPPEKPPLATANWEVLTARYEAGMNDLDWKVAEQYIGVSRAALQRLRLGIMPDKQRHTFPMKNALGKIVGIRTREYLTKDKKALTGSRSGLFIPKGFHPDKPFLVCEGPTDTAAMLDLGFEVLGRPSCQGGVQEIVEIVQKWKPARVAILADCDAPGVGGARVLYETLAEKQIPATVFSPPEGIKDARAWKLAGATKDDVRNVIRKAGGM